MGQTCFTPRRQPPEPSKAVRDLLGMQNVSGELQKAVPILRQHFIAVAHNIHSLFTQKHDEVWLEHSEENMWLVSTFAADLNHWVKSNHGKELAVLCMCQVPIIGIDGLVQSPYFHRLVARSSSPHTPSSSGAKLQSVAIDCV